MEPLLSQRQASKGTPAPTWAYARDAFGRMIATGRVFSGTTLLGTVSATEYIDWNTVNGSQVPGDDGKDLRVPHPEGCTSDPGTTASYRMSTRFEYRATASTVGRALAVSRYLSQAIRVLT